MAAKVFVYEDNNVLLTTPNPVIVQNGEKLDLVNVSSVDVDFDFPAGPFGAALNERSNGKGGTTRTSRPAKGDRSKAYRYKIAIANQDLKKKGKASKLTVDPADPVIIIET